LAVACWKVGFLSVCRGRVSGIWHNDLSRFRRNANGTTGGSPTTAVRRTSSPGRGILLQEPASRLFKNLPADLGKMAAKHEPELLFSPMANSHRFVDTGRWGTSFAAAAQAVPPLLFGIRLWAAVCLALYVAFWLELDNAYWAGTTAALVCQPSLGASLRKG
jgi:Fusaric acid resistance protein family